MEHLNHLAQVNTPGTPGTLIFPLIYLLLSRIFFIVLVPARTPAVNPATQDLAEKENISRSF
jgi:hypothetical protein